MPKGLVKTEKDEEFWKKAKKVANDAGQKDNYAYITGVFKKMKGIKENKFDIVLDRICKENEDII